MTREISKFPFPKSLIEIHKGKDIDEAKKEFIEKIIILPKIRTTG